MSSSPDRLADITVPGPPQVLQVSDGIYAYIQPDGTWWINNTGFLVSPRGVISVDACSTRRRTASYAAAIAAVTPAPVRALVNTHHHGDHTFGNGLFPGAAIIAHERTRAEVIQAGLPGAMPFWDAPDWGELTLDPPFVTYTDQVTVYSGDVAAQVRHAGTPAHTSNDSIVWIPERSVLFSGDLIFNGGTPFVLGGSVAGAIEALEQVITPLGAQVIVPGHGPVVTGPGPVRGVVADTVAYLRFIQDVAAASLAAGVAPLDAARDTDLGPFAAWPDAERIVGNLYRAQSEARGEQRGAPLNQAAALADMVAYNGGRPLTCLA